MAKPHGSVRIGPISLFALIIVLCLAVLAVLSLTTARAELTITERQAITTTETYQLEDAAQCMVADVDAALSQVRSSGAPTREAALEAVAGSADYSTVEGTDGATISVATDFADDTLTFTLSMDSGRTLTVALRINDDATYTIEQWKTTTQWTDDGAGENLWLG